jgi:tetratricopeptide (TPR) repeat protein
VKTAAATLLLFALVAIRAATAEQGSGCGPTPYDCAMTYVQRGDFAQAIATLEPLVTAASDRLRTLNLLGIALTGAGRIDEADNRFREALRLDAAFYPARKNLAVNEFTRGRIDEAAREFERVLAAAPADEIAHVHLGEIAFQRRQPATAIGHYEQAGARVMQDPSWALHYAACLLDDNRTAAAVDTLRQLSPRDGKTAFEAGVLLGRAGAHTDAARFFATARTTADDSYPAAYNQLLMLVEGGDPASAAALADELTAKPDMPAELYNVASRAYLKAERLKEAYDALRTATRLEPTVEDNYVDLAAICLDHQNYDLGLEIIDIGLTYRPTSALLHLQRGVVLAMRASLGLAEEEFASARTLAPDLPGPYAGLAMIWMQTGRTDTAVEVLREEVRRRHGSHIVPYIFAVALMRSGIDPAAAEASEAIDALRTSIRGNDRFAPSHSELGRILLKRGEVEEAVRQLEAAVALDPNATGALYNLAQAYRRTGDRARAVELLARVSTLNAQERGDDPTADLKRSVLRIVRDDSGPRRLDAEGVRLADAGQIDRALAVFRDAIRLDPHNPDAHLHLALAQERSGKPQDALASYHEVLRLQPGRVEARYGIASVCARLGDLDGAVAMLDQVVAALPEHAEARYNLGVNLWNRYKSTPGLKHNDDLARALSALDAAVRLDPRQPRYRLAFGQLLADRGELARSIEQLRIAAAQQGDDAEYAYNFALALRLNGELEAAEAQARAALRRDPRHALAHRTLGLIMRQKGDLEAAASELRLAVAGLPDDAQGHQLLGSALLKIDREAEGIGELREAIRLDPTLVEARVALARAVARSGVRDAARAEQDEIKRLNARSAAVGRTLVLLQTAAEQESRGRLTEAIASLRQAAELSPEWPETHYQLGLLLMRMPEHSADAERSFREVLRVNPDHALSNYRLGLLLARRGDIDAARGALEHAAAVAPGLVDAARELARIAIEERDWQGAVRWLQRTLAWQPGDEQAQRDLQRAMASLR